MKYRSCIIASLMIAATPFLHAEPDANPVDVNAILNSLKTIKKQTTDNSKADKQKLVQQFMATSRDASGAVGYYEDAIRATKFEGQSRESTQFQEWKKAEGDRMKGKPFRDGLTLHLFYLGLTMERSAGVEVKDLLGELINYTQQVISLQDSNTGGGGGGGVPQVNKWGQPNRKPPSADSLLNPKQGPPPLDDEWMKQPLTSSIFVRWMQISKYVSDVENWEFVPGNVDGIYSKTILPEFRRVKDPRLLQYWDMRINRESAQSTRSGRNFDMDKFNQITMPNLLWSRSQELIALDQKNRGVMEMVKLIKSYPAHPNVPDWITQVEQILQPPAAASPAPVTPAVSSPAAAVPGVSPAPAVPVSDGNTPATLMPGAPTPSAIVPVTPN